MSVENSSESQIPWMEENFPTQSTSIPNSIAAEPSHVTTLVIFVVSALLTITLLFVIAIFIDCRHMKLQKLKSRKPQKTVRLKLPIPKIGRVIREDKATLADKMEECSSPDVIV